MSRVCHLFSSCLIRKSKVQSAQERPDGGHLHPLDVVFGFLLDEVDAFQHVGDVIKSPFLHLNKRLHTKWLTYSLQLPPSTRTCFIGLFLACFRFKRTCRVSAARLRSRTPSEDWPRSSTNFFVSRPSEVSYRVFSGGDLGAVEERKEGWRANVNASG